MTSVYSVYIFDRAGKCLFETDIEERPGRRRRAADGDEAKLVYGVLFSLKHVALALEHSGEISSVSTDRSVLHQYVSQTGYRFVASSGALFPKARAADFLRRVYVELFVPVVTRNPLWRSDKPLPQKFADELSALASASLGAE